MDNPEPVSSPQSVIPVLGYDDGTAMKELIVTVPGPGELLITEPKPRWTRRGTMPALGMLCSAIILLTAVVSLARPRSAPEDWPVLAGSMVGLLACGLALRYALISEYIHVLKDSVVMYKTVFFWKWRSVYDIQQIYDVYGLNRLGISRSIGVLCVRTFMNRTFLFSSCPRQDVFAAATILRQRLGLGPDQRPWYRKQFI